MVLRFDDAILGTEVNVNLGARSRDIATDILLKRSNPLTGFELHPQLDVRAQVLYVDHAARKCYSAVTRGNRGLRDTDALRTYTGQNTATERRADVRGAQPCL